MPLGNSQSTLLSELNRLANGGTYPPVNTLDEAAAARAWAGRTDIPLTTTDTVGVLNEIAGLPRDSWLDYSGVCNYLAGTTGLPAAAALRQIEGDPETPTPSQPLLLIATPGDESVFVNWAPPGNEGDAPVDNYRLTVQFHPELGTIETTTPGVTVTGLTNGQTYYFLVQAHNAFGWGDIAISPGAVPLFVAYPATAVQVRTLIWYPDPNTRGVCLSNGGYVNAGVNTVLPTGVSLTAYSPNWSFACLYSTSDSTFGYGYIAVSYEYTCPNGGTLNNTTHMCE